MNFDTILTWDIIVMMSAILSTKPMIVIGFISEVSFIVSILMKYKKLTKFMERPSIKRDIILSLIFIFCGLISPVYLLYVSFSDWSGWIFWVTLFLSAYVLLTFVVLVWFISSTLYLLRKNKIR